MSLYWNRSSTRSAMHSAHPSAGFTLFEMLIAMSLTAVIGAVLFQTWDLVMTSGHEVQQTVREREADRIAYGIVDNDLTAVVLDRNFKSFLPPLSRRAIVTPDLFYTLSGREKPEEKQRDDHVVLSFTTASTASVDGGSLGSLFCVEYVLRRAGNDTYALVRRERSHCGVPGDFPWTELVLFRGLYNARAQLVLAGGVFTDDWGEDERVEPVEIRLLLKRSRTGQEETMCVPMLQRRIDIDWE